MAQIKLPYAETLNYWKTGTETPDTIIERTCKLIEKHSARLLGLSFGSDFSSGMAAYQLVFEVSGDVYKLVWPVLPTKSGGDSLAAKRQAATFIFYDVKAKLLSAQVLGFRTAFFSCLVLPGSDGRSAAELGNGDLGVLFRGLLPGVSG